MFAEVRKDISLRVMGVVLAVSSVGCQIPSNPDLAYNSLQGVSKEQPVDPSNDFYKSREDFFEKNRYTLPSSILFGKDDHWVLQIAYGSGWVPGAFAIVTPGDRYGLCTPVTKRRIDAYQQLYDDFQRGKEARFSLVEVIKEGAKPNCLSYFDK